MIEKVVTQEDVKLNEELLQHFFAFIGKNKNNLQMDYAQSNRKVNFTNFVVKKYIEIELCGSPNGITILEKKHFAANINILDFFLDFTKDNKESLKDWWNDRDEELKEGGSYEQFCIVVFIQEMKKGFALRNN